MEVGKTVSGLAGTRPGSTSSGFCCAGRDAEREPLTVVTLLSRAESWPLSSLPLPLLLLLLLLLLSSPPVAKALAPGRGRGMETMGRQPV